jgi:CheY-like chemotaxis protein
VSTAQTILLVEDDDDSREVLQMLVESCGYELLEAADGAEALVLLREHHPCLILLDLMMPGMDGFQFREAQLREPSIASVPVVVLSGGGAVPEQAAAIGAVGYLVKPPELKEVQAMLSVHCRA